MEEVCSLTFIKMRRKIEETVNIPEGISCEVRLGEIIAKKGENILSRKLDNSEIDAKISGDKLIIFSEKGNRAHGALVKSIAAHLNNIFRGFNEGFVYNLEACNVHFPMTAKIEKDYFVINNFLGEKKSRKARIVKGAIVEISEQKSPTNPFKIVVKSKDREAAGQTAANIEKATKVSYRDRRVFQDGIYIVSKPRRNIK